MAQNEDSGLPKPQSTGNDEMTNPIGLNGQNREREKGDDNAASKKMPEWIVSIQSFLSGDFLNNEALARVYNIMFFIAFLFFLNILFILVSFTRAHQRDELEDELTLLRDKSIRSKEIVYKKTAHSSILEEIEKRNLKLHDPTTPSNVIH